MATSRRYRILTTSAVVSCLVVASVVAIARVDVGEPNAPGRSPARDAYADVAGGSPWPNLVLVVVDTLREDALRPERMPYLHSLASEGVSFRNACATAPWTVPSLGSVLTGLLPTNHGNLDPDRVALPSSVTTYAEALRAIGYETLALTSGGWFGDSRTLLQGFDRTERDFHLQGVDAHLGKWARARNRERPFFLLLHTYQAHDPYGPVNHPWPLVHGPPVEAPKGPLEPWQLARTFFLDRTGRDALIRSMGPGTYIQTVVRYNAHDFAEDPRSDLAEEIRGAYHAGVSWVDSQLRGAVGSLERLGLLDERTLLVVAGDHGESFGEHGQLGHGHQLYDELVHVPLVMRGPAPFRGGLAPLGSVSLMDVLPTFLEWISMPPLPGADGRSMFDVLHGGEGRPVFAEERVTPTTVQYPMDALLASVRTRDWKYVATYDQTVGDLRQELYHLATDPREAVDLHAATERPPTLPRDVCRAIRVLREHLERAVPVRPASESLPTAEASLFRGAGPCD